MSDPQDLAGLREWAASPEIRALIGERCANMVFHAARIPAKYDTALERASKAEALNAELLDRLREKDAEAIRFQNAIHELNGICVEQRARADRLRNLLKRAGADEAVCVCHLRIGGCWPCEVKEALAREEGKK